MIKLILLLILCLFDFIAHCKPFTCCLRFIFSFFNREIFSVANLSVCKKDKLGEREISELKRIGFELKSESNHYKFIYRDNEKYTFKKLFHTCLGNNFTFSAI